MEIVRAFNTNNLHTDIVIKGSIEEPLFRASDIGEILEMSNIRAHILNFDESERHVNTIDTSTGNKEVIFLTEKGLYKILFKSRKHIAEIFQNWVCDVIKEIRLHGTYTLQQKLKEKENENIELQKKLEASNDNSPTIYIWNTNTQEQKSELKIGITLNVHKRVKPYKQINKHGKIEFTMPILNVDIKMFEKVIHTVLHNYKIKDEVFKLDIEEAKLIIINFANFIKLTQITNESERINKMQKIYENQNSIINNINDTISISEIGTQTQTDIEVQTETNIYENTQDNDDKNNQIDIFKKYIDEQCIVRNDVEISSIDILGQFRIWAKVAKKENYHALKDYLDTKFKYCRLLHQNKNQVIHGYKGITLKEIIYKKHTISSDVETFIFHSCFFSPSSKVLHSVLENEYLNWKKINNKQITDNESKELRTYLKNNEYALFTTIWTTQGNGQGYYGVELKNEKTNDYKKTSSTGKKVEKRSVSKNELLGTWETIAKASSYEKMSSAKMSRCIKCKTIINDYYYITT